MEYQFVIHVVELAFLVAFMVWMMSIEDQLISVSKSGVWKAITYLGSITLENYLLMDFVIWIIDESKIKFPLSYMCVFVITFVMAGIIKLFSDKMSKFLRGG